MGHPNAKDLPHEITTGGEHIDRLFSLLKHRYRRYIVKRLAISEYPLLMDQLAIEIAAREQKISVDDVSMQMADRICAELHHAHFPKLQEESIIGYDRTSGEVFSRGEAKKLHPFLETVAESKAISGDV